MSYLLDTCVISEFVKKKPEPKVIRWLKNCREDKLYLSVLTLGEIQKGISLLSDAKKKMPLTTWLHEELPIRFEGRIIGINEDVALQWGQILGKSQVKGIIIPAIDGLIAASALVHHLTVVTRNKKDIEKSGVSIFDPWEDKFTHQEIS